MSPTTSPNVTILCGRAADYHLQQLIVLLQQLNLEAKVQSASLDREAAEMTGGMPHHSASSLPTREALCPSGVDRPPDLAELLCGMSSILERGQSAFPPSPALTIRSSPRVTSPASPAPPIPPRSEKRVAGSARPTLPYQFHARSKSDESSVRPKRRQTDTKPTGMSQLLTGRSTRRGNQSTTEAGMDRAAPVLASRSRISRASLQRSRALNVNKPLPSRPDSLIPTDDRAYVTRTLRGAVDNGAKHDGATQRSLNPEKRNMSRPATPALARGRTAVPDSPTLGFADWHYSQGTTPDGTLYHAADGFRAGDAVSGRPDQTLTPAPSPLPSPCCDPDYSLGDHAALRETATSKPTSFEALGARSKPDNTTRVSEDPRAATLRNPHSSDQGSTLLPNRPLWSQPTTLAQPSKGFYEARLEHQQRQPQYLRHHRTPQRDGVLLVRGSLTPSKPVDILV